MSTGRAVRALAAHTVGMPVTLHHIVVDAHDLPLLADPEGNEFCVIRPKATLTR